MIKFNSRIPKYSWLSNFHLCSIPYGEHIYPSAEHLYQALKTRDKDARELIRKANHPAKARQLGKQVVIRSDWNDIKLDIMREVLKRKFSIPALRFLLMQTGEEELVEHAPWDSFWGDGGNGKGMNWTGKILMEIRASLRK